MVEDAGDVVAAAFDVDREDVEDRLRLEMTDTTLLPEAEGRGQLCQPRLAVIVTVAVSITTLVTRYRSSRTGLAAAKATSADATSCEVFIVDL